MATGMKYSRTAGKKPVGHGFGFRPKPAGICFAGSGLYISAPATRKTEENRRKIEENRGKTEENPKKTECPPLPAGTHYPLPAGTHYPRAAGAGTILYP